MVVTGQDLKQALRSLGLSGRVVCLHSSLRSFGHLEDGAATVIRTFLDEKCTLLVPTFSSAFKVAPPPHLQFKRNGWDYSAARPRHGSNRIYTPESFDIDREMGAIPAAVVTWPGHVRGNHPLDSLTAVGPHATELIAQQASLDVYAPLRALVRLKGVVILMGVGLERLTLLHLAEQEAGRTMFRRWANDERGRPMAVEVGGCSEGFGRLEPHLGDLMRKITVGHSNWMLFEADQVLARATAAIGADPDITHCNHAECKRCNDAIKGGPML